MLFLVDIIHSHTTNILNHSDHTIICIMSSIPLLILQFCSAEVLPGNAIVRLGQLHHIFPERCFFACAVGNEAQMRSWVRGRFTFLPRGTSSRRPEAAAQFEELRPQLTLSRISWCQNHVTLHKDPKLLQFIWNHVCIQVNVHNVDWLFAHICFTRQDASLAPWARTSGLEITWHS